MPLRRDAIQEGTEETRGIRQVDHTQLTTLQKVLGELHFRIPLVFRKGKAVIRYLLLFLSPALAFAEPVVSVNNPANIGQSLTTTVLIAPLDGAGNPMASLFQGVTWTFQQQTITATIPPSPTPYTYTGIHVWYRVENGTGVTLVKDNEWGGLYLGQASKNIPAGIPLNCVYSAPPIMAGDLTCTPGPDTVPPTAPGALTATSQSTSTINLTWLQATDNVGVASYSIERCLGITCLDFSPLGISTVLAYGDTNLTSGQGYSYRARAVDIAGNISGYSNTGTAVVLVPPPPPPPPPTTVCVRIPPVSPLTGEVLNFTSKIVDGAGATWTIQPRVLSSDTLAGQVSLWRTPPTGGVAVRQFGGIFYAYRKDAGQVCVVDDPKTGPAHSCYNGTTWVVVTSAPGC